MKTLVLTKKNKCDIIMIMNKLSHSAIQRYLMCEESYRLHYREKIRPMRTTSALFFGSAVDAGVNALLTGENAYEAFDKAFSSIDINGEKFDIWSAPIDFKDNDIDLDLLDQEAVNQIAKLAAERGVSSDNLLSSIRANQEVRHLAAVLSMQAKGKLLIKAYEAYILPDIEEVLAVQEPFEITNSDGDKIIGVVDLIAKLKGVGVVILDNKTSGRPYEYDSVKTSPQLALYVQALGSKYNTSLAGYLVLSKRVIKNKTKVCSKCGITGTGSFRTCNNVVDGVRCNAPWDVTVAPDIFTQVIIDRVNPTVLDSTLDEASRVNDKLHSGIFSPNDSQCDNWYGSKCPYFDLCKQGSMHNLVKLREKT